MVESLFRFIISALIILTAFGFDSFKSFFRRVGVFFCASFLYAGCMLGLWTVLNLNRVIINNGVVYIDVSPVLLITSTLVCYLIISVIRYFSKKHAFEGARCKIHIICKNKEVSVSALVDTGHSLTDALTEKEVVIIEGGVAENLLTVLPDINPFSKSHNLPKGFRLLPYSSVGGSGILPAFAPDEIWYERDGKKIKIKNVLLAISKEPLGEDYKAIISPTLLNK